MKTTYGQFTPTVLAGIAALAMQTPGLCANGNLIPDVTYCTSEFEKCGRMGETI